MFQGKMSRIKLALCGSAWLAAILKESARVVVQESSSLVPSCFIFRKLNQDQQKGSGLSAIDFGAKTESTFPCEQREAFVPFLKGSTPNGMLGFSWDVTCFSVEGGWGSLGPPQLAVLKCLTFRQSQMAA